MNYPKIALLVVLGLTATACGNDKTPNALSPSATPSATAPVVPAIPSPEATTGASTPTVAPLSGAPPLVPGTIPSSGVNPPGTYSGNSSESNNIRSGSNENSSPRRKKAQVQKVTRPSPQVTYYDTPVKGKPGANKPAKPLKEKDGDGAVEEIENPKKLPTKPVKKTADTSNDNGEEKEPAVKPAKSPKAEGGEGIKTKPPKADEEGGEGKKAKPAADAENKN